MLNSLKFFFKKPDLSETDEKITDELELLCGIMIEAASIDGTIDKNEILKIQSSLIDLFHENSSEVEPILKSCLERHNESKSLHSYTSKINKLFSNEKKIILLEILWEIVLVDGKIHDFESNLIRRLSGLMYISDIDCGNTKKRALAKITNSE